MQILLAFYGWSPSLSLFWQYWAYSPTKKPDLKITRCIISLYSVWWFMALPVYMHVPFWKKTCKTLDSIGACYNRSAAGGLTWVQEVMIVVYNWYEFPSMLFATNNPHYKPWPVHFDRPFCFTPPLTFLNTIIDPIEYYFRSKGIRLSLRRFGLSKNIRGRLFKSYICNFFLNIYLF